MLQHLILAHQRRRLSLIKRRLVPPAQHELVAAGGGIADADADARAAADRRGAQARRCVPARRARPQPETLRARSDAAGHVEAAAWVAREARRPREGRGRGRGWHHRVARRGRRRDWGFVHRRTSASAQLLLLALDLLLQLADLGEQAVDLEFLFVFQLLVQFAEAGGPVVVVVRPA
ncbi:hypothetical protein VTK26DRAFT_3525 [Humicola hyalothermophila]